MRGVEHIPWAYDAFMSLTEPFGLGRWRRRLTAEASGRTLEVGCGTGRNLPFYPSTARVVAFDPDFAFVLAARRRSGNVPLLVARAEALPFRASSFDTVVSSLVFCSVGNPQGGLSEIGRVLEPRGRLRMMEHVRHHRPFLARLQDRIQPAWTWLTGGCHPNRDTEVVVEAAGFAIDRESRRASSVMRLFTAAPTSPAPPDAPTTRAYGSACRPSPTVSGFRPKTRTKS